MLPSRRAVLVSEDRPVMGLTSSEITFVDAFMRQIIFFYSLTRIKQHARPEVDYYHSCEMHQN